MSDLSRTDLKPYLQTFRALGIHPDMKHLNDPKRPSIELKDLVWNPPAPDSVSVRVADDSKAREAVEKFLNRGRSGRFVRLPRNRKIDFDAEVLRTDLPDPWYSSVEPASVLWMKPRPGKTYPMVVAWFYNQDGTRRNGKALFWEPYRLSESEWGIAREASGDAEETRLRPEQCQWFLTMQAAFLPGHLVRDEHGAGSSKDRLISVHRSGKPIVVHGGAPPWCKSVRVRVREDRFEIQAFLLQEAARASVIAPAASDGKLEVLQDGWSVRFYGRTLTVAEALTEAAHHKAPFDESMARSSFKQGRNIILEPLSRKRIDALEEGSAERIELEARRAFYERCLLLFERRHAERWGISPPSIDDASPEETTDGLGTPRSREYPPAN